MQRNFEEVGISIAGLGYGHFAGVAEWDEHGDVVLIEIEGSGFESPSALLGIGDLVRERKALRAKYGVAFLEDGAVEVQAHARKWALFHGLSDSLRAYYAEDVADEQTALRWDASARRRGHF